MSALICKMEIITFCVLTAKNEEKLLLLVKLVRFAAQYWEEVHK